MLKAPQKCKTTYPQNATEPQVRPTSMSPYARRTLPGQEVKQKVNEFLNQHPNIYRILYNTISFIHREKRKISKSNLTNIRRTILCEIYQNFTISPNTKDVTYESLRSAINSAYYTIMSWSNRPPSITQKIITEIKQMCDNGEFWTYFTENTSPAFQMNIDQGRYKSQQSIQHTNSSNNQEINNSITNIPKKTFTDFSIQKILSNTASPIIGSFTEKDEKSPEVPPNSSLHGINVEYVQPEQQLNLCTREM